MQNQCCGAYGPEDWDLNVYFNCSGASYSREKCGVPFSCCVPDPAVSRLTCGQFLRSGMSSSFFPEGSLSTWLPFHLPGARAALESYM